MQLTSSCLTIFLGIGDIGDMKWEKNCFFLFAAFWNEGKKISVTIGEKKTEQSDVMNESKNEPEILWCLCKKKKEKKRKEKKREKQQHRGWQSMQWRVANWQKSLLLPFAKQPKCFTPAQQFSTDFFSFLRLPDEIRFFLASNFVFFLFCFLFLIRQKTKEEKKMYLFLIDFLVNWHHIPRCIASLMLDYRFGWRQNYLFR